MKNYGRALPRFPHRLYSGEEISSIEARSLFRIFIYTFLNSIDRSTRPSSTSITFLRINKTREGGRVESISATRKRSISSSRSKNREDRPFIGLNDGRHLYSHSFSTSGSPRADTSGSAELKQPLCFHYDIKNFLGKPSS